MDPHILPTHKEIPNTKRILELRNELDQILSQYPHADREDVWHTLLLLEETPLERLRRALRRGQHTVLFR